MGKQIGFLQSELDELEFIEFISKDSDYLALPFTIPRKDTKPESLKLTSLTRLNIFRERLWPIIESNFLLNSNNEYSTRNPNGYYFEWTKSRINISDHPNMNYEFGRLYFNTWHDRINEDVRENLKMFNRCVSFIKRTYPFKTNEKNAKYIGKHLVQDILKKNIRLKCRNVNQGDLEWKDLELKTVD